MVLSATDALGRRDELVARGYTAIPGVMPPVMVEELRAWSDAIVTRTHVRYAIRYQGSDLFAHTERGWAAMAPEQRQQAEADPRRFRDPRAERIIGLPAQAAACRALGLEELRADEVVIILSKPAHGPPLYWHQDFMQWHSPRAATLWPTRIFLSYYLVDTTRENGCLRVIPGSHRKRHRLHDLLPDAHGQELQALEDRSHPAFSDDPDAVDVPLRAGDLLIADARLLHAAWPNRSDRRRTLLLAWHDVFSFPRPPSWWRGETPAAVRNADPAARYENDVRTPSHWFR